MNVLLLKPSVSSHVRSGHCLDSVTQCVLELVQNSVDACASSLVVKVDTSSWRIQVSDNGHGISQDDLSLVGQRYATSKCCDLEDLQHPHYFGFRGEALASIVQVARTVELISRHHLSQLTYCKVFQGGRDTGVVPSTELLSKAGTTVTVHDLFYNLPVRQRHMSPSLVVETLKSALCKALLVLPTLSLSLLDHQAGQKLLHVPKAGSLLARLHQLFGRVKDLRIQETFVEHAKVKISALLSVAALSSRYMQLIFVNRRLVESGSLHELVSRLLEPVVSQSKAKDTHTTKTRCPFYVIVIEGTVDLDVCLHPAKTHIHFEREESVHAALTCLIGSFLAENHFTVGYSPSPVIPPPSRERQPPRSSVPVQSRPPVCQPVSQAPTTWGMAVDPVTSLPLLVHPVSGCTHNSRSTPRTLCGSDGNSTRIASAIKDATSVRVHSTVQGAGSLSSLLSHWNNPTFSAGDQAILTVATHRALSQCKFSKTSLQQIKVVGQVDRKFITCLLGTHTSGSPDLLVAVDQHAAHERVRLEALLEGLCDDQQQVRTAEVTPPLPLSLTPSQQKLARHFSAQLAAIGVQLVWREGQPLASSLPAVLMEREAAERQRGRPAVAAGVLQEMVHSHLELLQTTGGGVGGLPPSLASLLHSQACHGAIKFGDGLQLRECEELVSSLSTCSLPFQCAHGRPSLAPLISLRLLARRFPGQYTPFPSLKGLSHRLNDAQPRY